MAYKQKTRVTEASVGRFLDAIPDTAMRDDCRAVAKLMEEVTKEKPKMWGTSIVGFGTHDFQGASGTSRWMRVGFAPRTTSLTLYITTGIEAHAALFSRLGKYGAGKGCLYLKRLTDVDFNVLGQILRASVARLTAGELDRAAGVTSKALAVKKRALAKPKKKGQRG